jgi:hypothetical protein
VQFVFKLILEMSKILYKISFYIAIVVLLVGIVMKFFNSWTHGFSFSKIGSLYSDTIDGNGIILLSFLLLIFSFWAYKDYKTIERKKDLMRNHEANEIKKRKLKIIRK